MALIYYPSYLVFILSCGIILGGVANTDILKKGSERLGRSIYTVLSRDEGNVVFSPLNIYVALSLLYYGSAGVTFATLKNALGAASEQDIATAYKSFIDHIEKKGLHLEMATKIYAADSVKLQNKYQADIFHFFNSEIENVNFGDALTAVKINKWIAENTHNSIQSISPSNLIKPATRLILLNSLHFNSDKSWASSHFSVSRQQFYTPGSNIVYTSMISMSGYFEYNLNTEGGYQFIRIPYANEVFSLSIVLPTSKRGLADLERRSNASYYDLRGKAEVVDVLIPSFKIESEISYNSILRQIHDLGILFDKVDIPSIVQDENMRVDNIFQKVSIEVRGNGTKATAGTYDDEMPVFRMHQVSAFFTADHPFLFFLEVSVEGVRHVLLHGRVTNPEAN